MLRFFVDIGLSLEQAIAARDVFLTGAFGFSLLNDRSDPTTRGMISQPVPRPWHDALPDVPAPLSREAAALPPQDSDEMFEAFIELRVAAIETMLDAAKTRSRPAG